ELKEAVVKINSFLSGKDRKKQSDAFNQDGLEIMGIGRYQVKLIALVIVSLRQAKLLHISKGKWGWCWSELMTFGCGAGRKGRSYLLLLLRMNQLVAETNEGSIYYRVPAGCC
ncbi:hypothetical protein GW17_00019037, partial [Ensete ventricosum]